MPSADLARSPHRIDGELRIGGQEHFYLETQCRASRGSTRPAASRCTPPRSIPAETQEIVARVLGVPRHQVTVECLRMGGAFGGKEMQANAWAAIAALGAWKTGRPVRVRLPRVLDMALTGKRHPFLARFDAASTTTAASQALAHRALFRRRLEPRSLRSRSCGARCSTATTPTTCRRVEVTGCVCQHAQDVADRLPRLRRTAGHAGDRGHPGPQSRARSDCRRRSCASATSIAKATPRTTASR